VIRDEVAAERPVTVRRWDTRRVYAALIFIPLFYLVVRYLPPAAFFALVLVAAGLALVELYRLHFHGRPAPMAIAVGLVNAGLLLTHMQWPDVFSLHSVLAWIIGATLLFYLLSAHDLNQSLVDVSVLVFGALYIGFTMGHLLLTRALPEGTFLIFFVVLVTWAGDTGAYYVGISMGRTRLAPKISPQKTVEGLLGGCVLAVLMALLARLWFLPSFSFTDAVVMGITLTLAGLVGDLSESMFKRSAGVKDSGGLIPGHGGMLDRLDSLLLTAPTYYYYVTLMKG
jgi:phosphatidate cytidylyltransferase